ncbi:MAG TPA: HemK2/MTQ2 family protein methyltransferase [Steroidobacteraceae bacterium]|jgi:release factor glutamine methyltransferase|nr:HemK2/MTQ2 family protein methyltransferase [Steroidobacteraceae bacterium]
MLDLAADKIPPAPAPLGPPPVSYVGSLIGKLLAAAYRLTGKARYDDFRLERVGGVPILVIPSVFNPKVPRTGEFLAIQACAQRIAPEADVLDLGTGSGVGAVFAALCARHVVAVDINPAAVRCAAINARLNQLEDKIDVREGDLFAPVTGERFDLVLFNPPFLRGTPRDDRDRAWRSSDVAERFAAGLGAHLKPGGMAFLLLSSFGDAQWYLAQLRAYRYEVSVLAERRYINETLRVFKVVPARPEPAP